MGGKIAGIYVARVNAFTLEVEQKVTLPRGLYIGGLLVHSNGNVYCMHANTLYTFWAGDLLNCTVTELPAVHLNGKMVQTNGMLVTQDGNIYL